MIPTENNKNIKVLVVTYDFYPDHSPNTYRWKNVLEAWADRGVEIFVVAAQKEDFQPFEIINKIKVYRTGKSWLEKIKAKILSGLVTQREIKSTETKVVRKQSIVRRIYNLTWKKLYFPDFAFLWLNPARKLAAEIIEREGINNLITVSWPFTDHVVGSSLKNKYNLNWIADTIDPFYLSEAVNNNFLYSNLNLRYEYKILKNADAITVLTEKLKIKYSELFPLIRDKIFVNHNLYIPQTGISNKITKTNSPIKLVFVGTLSLITRSPENLLRLFVQLSQRCAENSIELHFYGFFDDCQNIFLKYEEFIGRVIFIHGVITKEHANEVLHDADILVNIGNSNPYQEPSKIIEYMYLQKPILNVCSIMDDSVVALLNDYPLKFNIHPGDYNEELFVQILVFINSTEKVEEEDVKKLTSKYMLNEVDKRYFNLLQLSATY